MADIKSRHPEDEELERYSLGVMAEEETEVVEQHLLICDACQERLDETDAFVKAMVGAARAQRRTEEAGHNWFPFNARWIWAAAACAAVVVVLVLVRGFSGAGGGAVAVVLEANRGGSEVQHVAGTSALELHPDVAGLPAADHYLIEVVDASGAPAWHGELRGAQVRVPKLGAGSYFVRIQSPARQLLREYSLTIDR